MSRVAATLLLQYLAIVTSVAWAAPVSVLTYHNDKARTGANLDETVLAPSNVNTNNFGRLFTHNVDGYVYAQPLVLANVTVPAKGVHNVVFVVTEHDSVYAFDADGNAGGNAAPLWHVSFINPPAVTSVPSGDVNCDDLVPEIGITSTPVIDPATGTIYVEAKTEEVSSGVTSFVQRLHALDVATGAEKFGGPIVIQGSVPGSGDGNDGSGHLPFDAQLQLQRSALLLFNGVVYFAVASHCDINPYHGWFFGYDATNLQQVAIFNASPDGGRAGIWMSGGGASADANGHLYFSTGNGTFDANTGGTDYGDSILELSTNSGLTVTDYFTPFDQANLDANDNDLGSGGILLLPDQPGPHPHLAITGGKAGTIYVLDRDNLGHFQNGSDSQIVQSLPNAVGGLYSTLAYFNGTVYCCATGEVLKAFGLNNGLLSSNPISQATDVFDFPGATASISANGTNDGIVWLIQRSSGGPAVLRAYNAANVAEELYSSSQVGADNLGAAVKFAVPTVANGKVYVGTQSALSVFGNFASAHAITPGDWEVMISGADKGIAILTVSTATASGYGIRLKKLGLDTLSGTWSLDAKGKLTGTLIETLGSTTNWIGTLLGSVKTNKSLAVSIATNSATKTTFKWKGVPATTFPDLSGTWSGQVTIVKTASNVVYAITTNTSNSGAFDIATTADPSVVVGQLLTSSRNRIYSYLTFNGEPITLSGIYNVKKRTISMRGSSSAGEKVKVQIVGQ